MTTRTKKTNIEEAKIGEGLEQKYKTTKQQDTSNNREDTFADLNKITEESKHNSNSGSSGQSGSTPESLE